MRIAILAAALAAASLSAHATGTAHVGYDPAADIGNFGTPGTTNNTTAYDVITSQTASSLSVEVKVAGADTSQALPFANIYLGGDTSVGIEVNNDRAFIPGGDGTYFSLAGTGFTWHTSGSAAGGDLEIDFTLPFSFLETDPLGMGFAKLGTAANDDFTRVSLSQSFGYSVAGGQANYGTDRLGSFTIPAAVPEPSSLATMMLGALALGAVARRRKVQDRA